ncbi:hypothetical protein, partial [Geobacillus stearothermophilus]|uniref:hypothetical protein n=1 Tax=Geobacillus stearothermophilus TaxID=1422 RepID=UPI002E235301|nr:hypothetical protein [Geobacillus stearothermophilus]
RGAYPLRSVFWDEGCGTVDAERLDTVVSALEQVPTQQPAVRHLTHLQEIRNRLPRRLIVEPAEPSGPGTRVRLEWM